MPLHGLADEQVGKVVSQEWGNQPSFCAVLTRKWGQEFVFYQLDYANGQFSSYKLYRGTHEKVTGRRDGIFRRVKVGI